MNSSRPRCRFWPPSGLDGVVIARDREPDRMRGQDFKTRFEVLRQALGGTAATGLGEFYAEDPDAPSSWSILFAAPSLRDGQVVGAVLAGIPLSRLAQAPEPSVPSRTEGQGEPPFGSTSTKESVSSTGTPPRRSMPWFGTRSRAPRRSPHRRRATPKRRDFRASSRSTGHSPSRSSAPTSGRSSFARLSEV